MRLTKQILPIYCTFLVISTLTIRVLASCYSCASPTLKDNWEITGLPAIPPYKEYFSAPNCRIGKPDSSNKPINCTGDCLFATYATTTGGKWIHSIKTNQIPNHKMTWIGHFTTHKI